MPRAGGLAAPARIDNLEALARLQMMQVKPGADLKVYFALSVGRNEVTLRDTGAIVELGLRNDF